MTRIAYTLALAVALCALVLPAVASASPSQVIRDCQMDGDLDRKYSNEELRQAQDNMPSDVAEYSDCGEVIAAAVTAGSDKGGRSNSGGDGDGKAGAASNGARGKKKQAEKAGDDAALNKLTQERNKPDLTVGGRSIEPGDNGLFNVASATNGLPLPVLLALIAAVLVAAIGGLLALRRRVPALGKLPLLSKISLPGVPAPRERN